MRHLWHLAPDLDRAEFCLAFILENLPAIGAASLGLLLIGFSQSAGDARSFATRHKYRADINQESAAQGMANVGSGVEIIDQATSHDSELWLARVKTTVMEFLQRDGVIERLGEDRIYGNVYEAAADKIHQQGSGGDHD